jgi:hypothetical protein
MGRHPERSDRQEACHPERNEGSAGRDASLALGVTVLAIFRAPPQSDS